MPVRKIKRGSSGIRGQLRTEKSENGKVQFESKLERDYYVLLDYDRTVWSIEEQPFEIKFEMNGKQHTYVPDVYIRRSDGLPDMIAEIKYYRDLKKDIKKLKPKFEAARQFCEEIPKQTDFVVLTDLCPQIKDRYFLANVHFLIPYKSFNMKSYEKVYELFEEGIPLYDLLSQYSDDKMVQMAFVREVWAMVRKGVIEVDMYRPMTLHTELESMRFYDEKIDEDNRFGIIEGGYLA